MDNACVEKLCNFYQKLKWEVNFQWSNTEFLNCKYKLTQEVINQPQNFKPAQYKHYNQPHYGLFFACFGCGFFNIGKNIAKLSLIW